MMSNIKYLAIKIVWPPWFKIQLLSHVAAAINDNHQHHAFSILNRGKRKIVAVKLYGD